jgi:hypothetical protein
MGPNIVPIVAKVWPQLPHKDVVNTVNKRNLDNPKLDGAGFASIILKLLKLRD